MNKCIRIIATVLFYGIDILVSSIIFAMLFYTPLFRNIDVLFYRGVVLLIISAVFAAIIVWIGMRLFKKLELGMKDVMAVFFSFLGLTLAWFTLVPVTVERSISVYMLSYMDENDTKEITAEEFGKIFMDDYIEKFGAFEKRFEEQSVSGNIKEQGDGYVITDSGRFVVNLFRLASKIFATDRRLVHPNDY